VALKRVTSSSKSANVVLEIDGQLSGCVVGNPYLGIISGVPVIQKKSLSSGNSGGLHQT
jgi:hypothetical protein